MPEPTTPRGEPEQGVVVVLADGRRWRLPDAAELAADPAIAPLLAGIDEAEDPAERLRAELALTIRLLVRSGVEPAGLDRLLGFGPDAPARHALQEAVGTLARSVRRVRPCPAAPPEGAAISGTRPSALVRLFRALWPLGTT